MIIDLRGKRDPLRTFATSLGRRRRTGEISQFRPRPQTKKLPFFTNLINNLFIDGLPIKNGDFPWLC